MKAEIIASLEKLLETEDVFEAQKEFKKLNSQYKALLATSKVEVKKEDQSSQADETATGAVELDNKAHTEAIPDQVEKPGSMKTTGVESETETAPSEPSDEPPVVSEDAPADAELDTPAEPIHSEVEKATSSEGAVSDNESGKTETEAISDDKPIPSEPATASENASSTAEITENQENSSEMDALDARFQEIGKLFKSKISDAKAAKQKIEEETLAKAKDLLSELELLVTKEENIGKAFSGFNAIREHWKALPKVSNDDYRDLNVEYNKLVEQFFYNINIYKELKELDLKHNLEQKLLVLEDQKKLLELNDIRLLEVDVRMNQDRWNEIGPTFKDDWEKLKDEFWSTTRTIYSKIQAFYDQRREEFEKNLEAKKKLLEEVQRIAVLELKSPKKWQEKTKAVIDLQQQWKMIGFVPKEKAGPIWKEFRKTCDAFFEKKRSHFAEIHSVHEANKHAKENLVTQAEQLKDSTEWNETSNTLIKLQNDWKKIGPAHQRDDNALWRRFRQACDHFFTARNAQRHGEVAEQSENLSKKKAIIEEVEAHKPGKDQEKNVADLKAFGEKWRAIGHVPFKEKDAVNKAYKIAMDKQFDALNIERKVRQKMQFEEKVENLKEARGSDKLLQKEEDHLRNKINKLKAEINQYENNMGFFANSKGADKLKEEVIKKIDKAKGEVDELKEQLQMLKNA